MIHGRLARSTRPAFPAFTLRDRYVTSSRLAFKIRFGLQNRRNSTSAAIEMTEALISTSQGPCSRATANWLKPKLTPATRIAGHTSIIDLKPAYAQMSQNGTSMQNGVTSVAATRVNIKVSSPVTPCRAMMGIPRPPKATGAVLPATIVPRILPV